MIMILLMITSTVSSRSSTLLQPRLIRQRHGNKPVSSHSITHHADPKTRILHRSIQQSRIRWRRLLGQDHASSISRRHELPNLGETTNRRHGYGAIVFVGMEQRAQEMVLAQVLRGKVKVHLGANATQQFLFVCGKQFSLFMWLVLRHRIHAWVLRIMMMVGCSRSRARARSSRRRRRRSRDRGRLHVLVFFCLCKMCIISSSVPYALCWRCKKEWY
jgi:hypothetical protein